MWCHDKVWEIERGGGISAEVAGAWQMISYAWSRWSLECMHAWVGEVGERGFEDLEVEPSGASGVELKVEIEWISSSVHLKVLDEKF